MQPLLKWISLIGDATNYLVTMIPINTVFVYVGTIVLVPSVFTSWVWIIRWNQLSRRGLNLESVGTNL